MALVILAVRDLIFRSKISAVAQELGVKVRAVAGLADLESAFTHESASGMILDLNSGTADQDQMIKLALSKLSVNQIVSFYSHVDSAAKERAAQAGLQEGLPRSRFVQLLPELLRSLCEKRP